jgi:non-specific serine/threonine protein kinase
MVGETISHYRILERLGAGGMGEVYKAEDLKLHRPVALKLMINHTDSHELNEQTRARFLREARAASALNHPNIAVIYEIDEFEREGLRCSFIAMEYASGQTLKELGADLTTPEILEVISQVADGLSAAHQHGIVHRDIKPSNIVINSQLRVKILDFGVAKYNPLPDEDAKTSSLYQTEMMKTTPGTVIGTFAYMSPEQALGKEIDRRSDIFSLGVLFYELLAGRLPFTGASTLAMVDAILHADPPLVGTFNYRISRDIEQIVHRMLAKEVSSRYQSMSDLLIDLDAVKQGLPITPDPYETHVSQVVSQPTNSTSGPRTFSGRKNKTLAVMNFSNITRNPADDWLGVGFAETVTADLKKIEGLNVIGRERIYEVLRRWNISSENEIDTTVAASIGREVGARWIITGGYQRIGEMLRITARAVDIETGEVYKTVKIDGQMKDIFDLQDKIVLEMSRDLDLKLYSGERSEIEQKETEVFEAYEAYVKAEMALDAGSREGIDQAIESQHQAIALDPKYAKAYAGLGLAITLKGQFLSQQELIEEAFEYFQKAIELKPMLADGYAGLGMAFVAAGRDDDAIGALRRALSFAPNDHQVHGALGRAYMIGKGMFNDAVVEYERALELNPKAGWAAQQLALCCVYSGNYELGMQAARQAIEGQEQYISGQEGMQIVGSYAKLAHLYYFQGKYDDAIAECYREIVFLRNSNHALKERTLIEVNQKLVSAYVRQGNMTDARATYNRLIKSFEAHMAVSPDDPFTRYYLACACAMMGEAEKALDHLQIAIKGRPNYNRSRARIEIDFEGLRADERFQKLIDSKQ